MGFGYCHLPSKIVPIQNKKTHNLIAYSITVSNSTTSLILRNCHDSSNWTIFSFFMTHHFIFKIKWRPVCEQSYCCFSTPQKDKKKTGTLTTPSPKWFSDNKQENIIQWFCIVTIPKRENIFAVADHLLKNAPQRQSHCTSSRWGDPFCSLHKVREVWDTNRKNSTIQGNRISQSLLAWWLKIVASSTTKVQLFGWKTWLTWLQNQRNPWLFSRQFQRTQNWLCCLWSRVRKWTTGFNLSM